MSRKQERLNELTNQSRAQMRKGILELCVLLLIDKEEKYASDIIEEMKQSELILVEGTLYPLLTRLKNEGILDYRWVESQQGPPRKYYKLTPLGGEYLNALVKGWNELNETVDKIKKK